MRNWYVDPDSIAEAVGADSEDILEFLQEMRQDVDVRYPRGDKQAEFLYTEVSLGPWFALHYLMYSLEQDEE